MEHSPSTTSINQRSTTHQNVLAKGTEIITISSLSLLHLKSATGWFAANDMYTIANPTGISCLLSFIRRADLRAACDSALPRTEINCRETGCGVCDAVMSPRVAYNRWTWTLDIAMPALPFPPRTTVTSDGHSKYKFNSSLTFHLLLRVRPYSVYLRAVSSEETKGGIGVEQGKNTLHFT